ncbi:MAG: glycosyltransferase family 4 protein [Patescibacteria group bacterium]|jgi:glycosyltransferase involved in cell wall biosynthesis
MLTPYLPYPPSSGGQIRTYNLLKYLSKNNQITLISLYKNEQEKKYITYLKSFCSNIYLCKRAERPWQLKNMLKAILFPYPFLVVRNFSDEAKEKVSKLLHEEHFDVIHAETFYIMPHLPETKIPVLLVEQTIEYQVYQHFVDTLPKLVQPIFNRDITKLIYWEKYYWRKANVVATVSLSDKLKIEESEPKTNLTIVPNGAGDDMMHIQLKPRDMKNPKLLFIGNFSWLQNTEAAHMLMRDIFPEILKKIPTAQLIIAGQNADKKLTAETSEHVEVINISTSDTQIVPKLYEAATLFIAPIHGPGGTRLKLLAAMAAGLPIVSTSIGVEGLDLTNGSNVLIAEDREQFIAKVENILREKKLFSAVQRNAYQLVREKFNWEKIALKLEEVYQKLTQT